MRLFDNFYFLEYQSANYRRQMTSFHHRVTCRAVTVLSSEVAFLFIILKIGPFCKLKLLSTFFVRTPSSTFSNAHALDESQNSAFRLKSFSLLAGLLIADRIRTQFWTFRFCIKILRMFILIFYLMLKVFSPCICYENICRIWPTNFNSSMLADIVIFNFQLL